VLVAEARRSARRVAVLGGSGVIFGLVLLAVEGGRGLYVFGLIPLPWLLVAVGVLLPTLFFAQLSELRALDFRLVADGVYSRDAMIPWDEVAEVYHGGAVVLAKGVIRSGEIRRLRIVAKNGRAIDLELRLFGGVSKEVPLALAAITDALIGEILDRQRRELDARLDAGERVRFGDALWVGADGVAKSREDAHPIALASITGVAVDVGALRLHYTDGRGRPRTRALGKVQEIANVHLLERALRPREPSAPASPREHPTAAG
jgi:hypothetical protein